MKTKFSAKMFCVGATTALLAGLPMLMATPAQASTTLLQCTVTPKAPVHISDDFWTGVNRARFSVTVKCPGARIVVVKQQAYETTGGVLTKLAGGFASHTDPFILGGTTTNYMDVKVPNTAGTERVLQKVTFTVWDPAHIEGRESGAEFSGSVLIT